MTLTVAQIQSKILEKVDQKYKGGVSKQRLDKGFRELDLDGDGFLRFNEFAEALSVHFGNPISGDESQFLFQFWDTMAGQQEPQGAIEIDLAVQDLLSSVPQYGTGFNSGHDGIKSNKGAKGNMPSQAGGIFGGGSYEADANNMLSARSAPMDARSVPMQPEAPPSSRPRGNQSSIPGGIFGEAAPTQPPLSGNGQGSNRSNQSSIAGGIFGEGPAPAAQKVKKFNSNQSSIPGGIFG